MIPEIDVGFFLKSLKRFEHPIIDPDKTQLILEGDPEESCSLTCKLYDHEGRYVVEDRPITTDFSVPGLLISFKPKERSIHMENMYFKPEFQRKYIGTGFVSTLVSSAQERGYHLISLVVDNKTEAKKYWMEKHHFTSPDPARPDYLELRV